MQSNSTSRNQAMHILADQKCVKRSEIVALDLQDFDGESGCLNVYAGSGVPKKIVILCEKSRRLLLDWVAARGSFDGPLFLPIDKAGHIGRRRLTHQAARYIALQIGDKHNG